MGESAPVQREGDTPVSDYNMSSMVRGQRHSALYLPYGWGLALLKSVPEKSAQERDSGNS